MYSLILTKAGHTVATADDGAQGLAKARTGGFDIILLDMMMPTIDGIGFLKAYEKEPPAAPNGPIVILSNAGYTEIADEAKELGAVDFLLKADLLPKDLVKAIEGYISNKPEKETE